MRLTVNLDRELYTTAVAYARNANCSISEAVNQLLRRSLERAPSAARRQQNGFPVVRGARSFSDADVERFGNE